MIGWMNPLVVVAAALLLLGVRNGNGGGVLAAARTSDKKQQALDLDRTRKFEELLFHKKEDLLAQVQEVVVQNQNMGLKETREKKEQQKAFAPSEEGQEHRQRHRNQQLFNTTTRPINDNCPNAPTIFSSRSGTTTGATMDNVGSCGGTDNTAPGVWYKVFANNTTLTATTCNSNTNYDTKISVFRGGCNNLVCVAGNDDAGSDSCSISFSRSTVTWTERNAQEYYVLVHGYQSQTGDFTLNINRSPITSTPQSSPPSSSSLSPSPNAAPVPTTLSPTFGFSASPSPNAAPVPTTLPPTFGFAAPTAAPTPGLACPAEATVAILCPSEDTCLDCVLGYDVSTAQTCAAFELIICNQLSSCESDCGTCLDEWLAWLDCEFDICPLTCGGIFEEGAPTISPTTAPTPIGAPTPQVPAPINNLCQNAIAVSDIRTGTTEGATLDDVELFDACGTVFLNGIGVWYTVSASNEVVTASTCHSSTNFDTQITVYRGSCDNLVCLDGNDDADPECDVDDSHSSVTWTATQSETFYVFVHGFLSTVGTFRLDIDRAPITPSPTSGPPTSAPTYAPTPEICGAELDATRSCASASCVECTMDIEIADATSCRNLESNVCGGIQSCESLCASCLNELFAQFDCLINANSRFNVCSALNCNSYFTMPPTTQAPTSSPSAAPSAKTSEPTTAPAAAPKSRDGIDSEESSSSTGVIVGGAVGGVAVVLIAVAVGTWLALRNRGRKSSSQGAGAPKPPPPAVPNPEVGHNYAAETGHHDDGAAGGQAHGGYGAADGQTYGGYDDGNVGGQAYGGYDDGAVDHQPYGAPSSTSGTTGSSPYQTGYARPYGGAPEPDIPISPPQSTTANQYSTTTGAPPVRFKDQAQTVVAITEAVPVPLEQGDAETRVSDMTPTSGRTRQSAEPDGRRL